MKTQVTILGKNIYKRHKPIFHDVLVRRGIENNDRSHIGYIDGYGDSFCVMVIINKFIYQVDYMDLFNVEI
jgi:hypothetical protein